MIRRLFIALLVLIGIETDAQDGLSLQFTPLLGTHISHSSRRKVPEFPHSGIAIDINKRTIGKKYWQSDHNFPQMGLMAAFQTMGNRRVFGDAFTLLPYLEFNVWRFTNCSFQIKHGTGIGWVTRIHDAVGNPENTLHSTRINATSIIDLGFRFKVTEKNDLKLGGVLRHLSNGGFQKPNSGSNTASAYLNYTIYLRDKPKEVKRFEPEQDFKLWRYRVMTSLGVYRKNGDGEVVSNTQVSALAFYQHNTRFRTGGGLELGFPYGHSARLAGYFEEEVQFGKLTTRYGLGIYTKMKNEDWEKFYSKVGIAYYPKTETHIPHKFFIGAMLKAHNFKAAHVEFNTGYTF
jgi:hypothetical protein